MINPTKWVFASDIDGTLTGNVEALRQLSTWLTQSRQQNKLFFILATGRNLSQVLEGHETEGLPQADAIICQVGTEIFLPPFSKQMAPFEEWSNLLSQQFSREFIIDLLDDLPLEWQPDHYNTDLKVSYFLHPPNQDQILATIQQRLSSYTQHYQMVYSSNLHLDFIPTQAGKGNAIRYLVDKHDLSLDRTVVAGDTGNDCSMFFSGIKGIVVNNAKEELIEWTRQRMPKGVFYSPLPFASGVLSGLQHFGVHP